MTTLYTFFHVQREICIYILLSIVYYEYIKPVNTGLAEQKQKRFDLYPVYYAGFLKNRDIALSLLAVSRIIKTYKDSPAQAVHNKTHKTVADIVDSAYNRCCQKKNLVKTVMLITSY